MSYKKVSVIIPCFNLESYIEECVLSAEKQMEDGLEIIIIDDCSSDKSYEICYRLSREYNNIKVVRHEHNMGVMKSRNDGIHYAGGEWVLFLDGDDVLADNAINGMIKSASERADFIISNFSSFDENTSLVNECRLNKEEYSMNQFVSEIGNSVFWGTLSCIGNKLYRLDFLRKNKIVFKEKYRFNEDGAFIVEAIIFGTYVSYYRDVTYHYRKRMGSSMHAYRKNSFWSLNEVTKLTRECFELYGCGKIQERFLKSRNIELLINCIENEIRYGSKKNFAIQYKKILADKEIEDSLISTINDNSINAYYRDYADLIINKREGIIVKMAQIGSLNDFYNRWIYGFKNGFINKLKNYNVSNVAVYGAGSVGRLIAREVEKGGIHVDFFIDRNKNINIIDGKKSVFFDQTIGNTQLIINSVLNWNEDVVNMIKYNTFIPVISIWEMMY